MRYQVYIDAACDGLTIDMLGHEWIENPDYHQADVVFVNDDKQPYWLNAYRGRVPIKPVVFVANNPENQVTNEFFWQMGNEKELNEILAELKGIIYRVRKIPDSILFSIGKDEYLKILAFAWSRDNYISPYVNADAAEGYSYTMYSDPGFIEERCMQLVKNNYLEADRTMLFNRNQRFEVYRFKLTQSGQDALLSGDSIDENVGIFGGRMVVRDVKTFLSFVKKFSELAQRYVTEAGVIIISFSTSQSVSESDVFNDRLCDLARKLIALLRDVDVVGVYDSQIVMLFPNTENTVLKLIKQRIVRFLENEVTGDLRGRYNVQLKDMVKYNKSISPEI